MDYAAFKAAVTEGGITANDGTVTTAFTVDYTPNPLPNTGLYFYKPVDGDDGTETILQLQRYRIDTQEQADPDTGPLNFDGNNLFVLDDTVPVFDDGSNTLNGGGGDDIYYILASYDSDGLIIDDTNSDGTETNIIALGAGVTLVSAKETRSRLLGCRPPPQ